MSIWLLHTPKLSPQSNYSGLGWNRQTEGQLQKGPATWVALVSGLVMAICVMTAAKTVGRSVLHHQHQALTRTSMGPNLLAAQSIPSPKFRWPSGGHVQSLKHTAVDDQVHSLRVQPNIAFEVPFAGALTVAAATTLAFLVKTWKRFASKHMSNWVLCMATAGEEQGPTIELKGAEALTPGPAIETNWALSKRYATALVDFINRSPSPFHATEQCRLKLEQHGFQQLSERESWAGKIHKGGKYYFTRNGSSIVAFSVGGKYAAGNGMKIVGAHSDSPNLQIKPNSATGKEGYQQVSVSTYGGGLWHTWLDRDLTLAGRVVVRTGDGQLKTQLLHINRPVLKIPNLCIHLQSGDEREAFKLSKENHLCPILCTAIAAQLEGGQQEEGGAVRHHSTLMNLLATELGCNPVDIVDFELSVCDAQPASLGGLYDEFVFAPRIDNLASCFCALEALCNSTGFEEDPQCRIIALFDNEEVGSDSYAGAGCTHLPSLLTRLTAAFHEEPQGLENAREAAVANSFVLSADCAHAVHPNYADKHHPLHRPAMHKGVVIKFNANQRYATTALTAAVVREIARLGNVPLQNFAVGNDTPCGSTIGPITATRLGVKTVDLGLAQLSMHSIRETCGVGDVYFLQQLFETFFNEGHKIHVADGE